MKDYFPAKRWGRERRHRPCTAVFLAFLIFSLPATRCFAQESSQNPQTAPPANRQALASQQEEKKTDEQIKVNWLYGAYVPKDVPLEPLNGNQRVQLWIRGSFTTYGIYFKTAIFSLSDHINDSPQEWGEGWGGYGKRVASRQGQFVIQNSLNDLGDGILGYEPRYDRCRCDGFWPRTGHAVARNFVTYDRTETKTRLQIPLYAAAFSAGVIAGTWNPSHGLLTTGGVGALTQVGFGILANVFGEFWPEIQGIWKRKKPANSAPAKDDKN